MHVLFECVTSNSSYAYVRVSPSTSAASVLAPALNSSWHTSLFPANKQQIINNSKTLTRISQLQWLWTTDLAIANRSRSASYSSPIRTCAECLLCQITYVFTQNTAEVAAGLQPIAARPYASSLKIAHWCFLPVRSISINAWGFFEAGLSRVRVSVSSACELLYESWCQKKLEFLATPDREFSYQSPGERILKIGPHLSKLLSNIK